MRRLFALIIALAAAGGCESGSTNGASGLRVVTTTSLLADAARQVGGEHVSVECLMGPGIDPHRYQPTAGDLGKLAAARVVLFHGLHLEGKMTDVLGRPQPGQHRAAITEAVPEAKRLAADGDGPHDPHVWMDPTLWAVCVRATADALSAADPAHADAFRANADRHVAEIEALHAENLAAFKSLRSPKLVTSHDAFRYFGRAYGVEVHGLQGVSTAAELSDRDRTALADLLGRNRIPAVFAETSVPPKGLKAVLDDVRAKYGHAVRLVGDAESLYSDSLGEPGSGADTYVGMLRHNVRVITAALK